MNEIILSPNSALQEYETLLLRRDALRKEALEWDNEYTRIFGELIKDDFLKQIECIRLKKAIAYCQARKNKGLPIFQGALESYLTLEMLSYEKELQRLIEDKKAADASRPIPEVEALEVRSRYRHIAKLIHPDVNPALYKHPEVQELWNRAYRDYLGNDLDGIKDDEAKALFLVSTYGNAPLQDFPDLEERKKKLRKEIAKIRSTDPYLYKLLLNNPQAVKEKKKALKDSILAHHDYEEELKKQLATYDEDLEAKA
jgi:hypothetical protein